MRFLFVVCLQIRGDYKVVVFLSPLPKIQQNAFAPLAGITRSTNLGLFFYEEEVVFQGMAQEQLQSVKQKLQGS